MSDYHNLKVWARGHQVAREIYRLTRDFPAEEQIGIGEELRRAAGLMLFPLAEGCARQNGRAFAGAIDLAARQRTQLAQLLLIARDCSLLPVACQRDLAAELSALAPMLRGLRRRLGRGAPGSRLPDSTARAWRTREPAPATPHSSA
jgi:four helix bundle protein